jgi:hypothetical protein
MDDLIAEKYNILRNAYNVFKDPTKAQEKALFKALIQLIYSYDQEAGKIVANESNRATLRKISRVINDHLSKSTYRSEVGKFLKNFDDVEAVQRAIIQKGNKGLDLSDFNLSTEKKLAVDEITRMLLNEDMIYAELAGPLQSIMYQHITSGISIKDAERHLKAHIIKPDNVYGMIGSFAYTASLEALSRYDGMINQKVAKEFALDGFRIVGSLIKTSEPQCVEMVRGTGRFEKYSLGRGMYRIEDLPKIISILKAHYRSVHPNLSPSNYFIYRNHRGCRHTFIPNRLLAREKQIAIEKGLVSAAAA